MERFCYYDFQIASVKQKCSEEILFFSNSEFCNASPFKERIEYLKTRIGLNKNKYARNITIYDNNGVRQELKKMVMTDYNKDLDKLTYSWPWNKLREIHKILKIKEFVGNLKYSDKMDKDLVENNRTYIINQLIFGLRNKKFNKNKSEIDYDSKEMIINTISCIEKNNKGLYEIDWDN